MFRRVWSEREIQRIAESQNGVVTRDQLIGVGVTDHEIVGRLREGRMRPRYDGVYYLDSVPANWLTSIRSALFACGSEAVVSHRTAAVLWGLDGVYGRMVEITVPYMDSPEPDGVIVHRTRRPNPAEVLESLPVTAVEKLILDLASMFGDRLMQKVTRSAVRKSLTTPERLVEAIANYGGRGVAGTRRARRVVALVADDQSGSVAEIDLGALIDSCPVPAPAQQLEIPLPDGDNAYPDFSWPDRLRIIEMDGFGAHGTPEQLQHDLRRQNQLMDLGWEIRRFTPADIRDRPEEVRAEIIRFVNKPVL